MLRVAGARIPESDGVFHRGIELLVGGGVDERSDNGAWTSPPQYSAKPALGHTADDEMKPLQQQDTFPQHEEWRVTERHRDFLKWYDAQLDESRNCHDELRERGRTCGLDKLGEGKSTFLHTIIKGNTKALAGREGLIHWFMEEYSIEKLYKKPDKQDFTVLDWALDPAHGDDTRVSFLMKRYPAETAELVLKDSNRVEAFLQFIVPNIGNVLIEHQRKKSTHKWKHGPLKFSLGDLKSLVDLALRRQNHADPATRARVDLLIQQDSTALGKLLRENTSYIHFIVPSLFDPKSKPLCDILFTKLSADTPSTENNPTETETKATEHLKASKTPNSPCKGHECWPKHQETGNTLLHRVVEHMSAMAVEGAPAVSSAENPPRTVLWQLELVRGVYGSCPSSLEARNDCNQSPYQFRLSTIEKAKVRKAAPSKEATKKSGKSDSPSDEISDFLKDKIMHLDRDVALDLLRGPERGRCSVKYN